MEKKVQLGLLFDFYGPLLTAHRCEIMRLYCEEDLSIAEIAEEMHITRQGIHDAVNQSQKQLQQYEEKLGLAGRYQKLEENVRACKAALIQIKNGSDVTSGIDEAISLLDAMDP